MSEESIIGKFFGVLGFKVDHHGVEEFQRSLDHVKHAVQGIFATELIGHVMEFVERSIGAAAAVNNLGEVTEMSAEKIAALGRVAIDNSSNVDAMKEAILGVYRATGQAAMGIGRNVKLFQALGLHAKDSSGHVKSAETMMGELADKFQKMDMAKVVATAGRLGIDPMIAKAMKEMGAEGWEKAVGEALGKGLLTEEDYRQADKTEKTFKRFHLITGQIAALLANQLAPWLRRAVDAIEKFITENKVQIVKKLHAAMGVLSSVLETIWYWGKHIWAVFESVYRWFNQTASAATAMKVAIGAIVALKLSSEIGKAASAAMGLFKSLGALPSLFGLAIIAVGLLIDDFLVWKEGGESFIGDVEQKWPRAFEAIKTIMEGLVDTMNQVVEAGRVVGLIAPKATAKTSMAWYKKMQENPPLPPSEDYAAYMDMKAMIESGQHPMQQLAAAPAQARENFVGTMQQRAAAPAQMMAELVEAKRAGASGATMYITGTKIEIKADTPERAEQAGESARDALASQEIRNYQPRGI